MNREDLETLREIEAVMEDQGGGAAVWGVIAGLIGMVAAGVALAWWLL